MENLNVTDVAEEVMDSGVAEAAKDVVVETVKATATSPLAIFLLIIAAIGAIATGAWVIFAIYFGVKAIRKYIAKKGATKEKAVVEEPENVNVEFEDEN